MELFEQFFDNPDKFIYDKEKKDFIDHMNSLKEIHNSRKNKAEEIKKIQSTTLDSVIKDSPYFDKKINFLSIDVEGNELNVLKGFNLKKYYPEVIVIEYLDLKMKELEFHNQDINRIINSEIYKYLKSYNYHLVNWLHSDLFFVNDEIRN